MEIAPIDVKKNITIFQGVIQKYNTYSSVRYHDALDEVDVIDENYYKYLFRKYNMNKLKSDDEITTCVNVLRWVHEQMLFSDVLPYVGELKTDEILGFCRNKRVTLNCALHSIVLSELLISMGIHCRSIQCLPFDPLDNDSHFINHAYIATKNKWIALDPSFATYFSDKHTEYCNLADIRQNIATNVDYQINFVTRFRNTQFDIEWYKAYLTKNVFRFSRTNTYRFSYTHNTIFYLEPLEYREKGEIEYGPELTRVFITDKNTFWS